MAGCSRIRFSGSVPVQHRACTRKEGVPVQHQKCTGTQRVFLPTRALGLRAQWFVPVHFFVYRYTLQTAVWQFLGVLFAVVAIPYLYPHPLERVLCAATRGGEVSPLSIFFGFFPIFAWFSWLDTIDHACLPLCSFAHACEGRSPQAGTPEIAYATQARPCRIGRRNRMPWGGSFLEWEC
uniref:Uncharacterized protein n=1 Tax=Ananas comosus var. bracteatus TaxID=296719 RepID=A0A6V7Q3L3_ANACO|nr:unnamed protein product [Ananas comosus var. bracteatus]